MSFKTDLRYGWKWALKVLWRRTKTQLKFIRKFVYMHGLKNIFVWSIPVLGTIYLLKKIDKLEQNHEFLSRYVIKNTYVGMDSLIKRIEELEKK